MKTLDHDLDYIFVQIDYSKKHKFTIIHPIISKSINIKNNNCLLCENINANYMTKLSDNQFRKLLVKL